MSASDGYTRRVRFGDPHAEPLPGRTIYVGPFVIYIERANGDFRDIALSVQPEGASYPVRVGFGSLPYNVLQPLMSPSDDTDYREFIAGSTHHVMASVAGRLRLLAKTLETMPREEISAQLQHEGDLLAAGCASLRTFLGVRA